MYKRQYFVRIGARGVIALTAVFGAIAFSLISLTTDALILHLSIAVVGVALGAVFPLTFSIALKAYPKEHIGLGVGIYESIFGLGFAAGPILGGSIADVFTPQSTYVAASIMMLVIAVAASTIAARERLLGSRMMQK